jgi:hypothetical protein
LPSVAGFLSLELLGDALSGPLGLFHNAIERAIHVLCPFFDVVFGNVEAEQRGQPRWKTRSVVCRRQPRSQTVIDSERGGVSA